MDEEYDVGKAEERVGTGFRRQLVRVGGSGHKEQMNFKLQLVHPVLFLGKGQLWKAVDSRGKRRKL